MRYCTENQNDPECKPEYIISEGEIPEAPYGPGKGKGKGKKVSLSRIKNFQRIFLVSKIQKECQKATKKAQNKRSHRGASKQI
ncbi:unnamed protein product [Meloidogyne enterolobii]|uniref:Uncharacterized protein n=1 Tax=Meloidogyne enterolobii TaxID=390850 RepID=A0ACB1B0I3_MELEN